MSCKPNVAWIIICVCEGLMWLVHPFDFGDYFRIHKKKAFHSHGVSNVTGQQKSCFQIKEPWFLFDILNNDLLKYQ